MGLILPVNSHWLGLGAGLSSQSKLCRSTPVGAVGNCVCLGQREGLQHPCPAILPY